MSASSPSSPTSDALPIRWAVILMTAVGISLVVGGLTFLQTVDWPAALLAAIGAGGIAVPAMHQILGK